MIHTRGFTLVELSIVLVIIALIAGGVLAGRDLINAAQIRQQVKQIEEFDTATNTFRGKYNCLPGDCARASVFGFGSALLGGAGVNGNGDGIISCGGASACWFHVEDDGENINYFRHLADAGLVQSPQCRSYDDAGCAHQTYIYGPLRPRPKMPYVGSQFFSISPAGIGLHSSGSYNPLSAAALQGSSTHFYYIAAAVGGNWPVIRPADARQLDVKIDDGFPSTGRVQAKYLSSDPAFIAANSNCIQATTPATYTTNLAPDCTLVINAQF